MRFGICTTDFSKRPMDELFAQIKGMGFDAIQFAFPSVSECDFIESESIEIPDELPSSLADAVKGRAHRYGLDIVSINGTFNMAHPDEEVRSEGVKRMSRLIETAARMEVPYITICTGSRSKESLWKRHEDNDKPDAWNDTMETLRPCLDVAEEYGISLLIETEASNTVRTAKLAQKIIEEMGSPALKIVLDPANLFLPGTAKKENVKDVLKDAVTRLSDHIVLAHGKDIKEGEDIDFCAAGRGIVDFNYMHGLLEKKHATLDMVLHGIYDESDMPRALAFMKEQWR